MHDESRKDYAMPQLKWWEVYRTQKRAGELLAAFELVEVLYLYY